MEPQQVTSLSVSVSRPRKRTAVDLPANLYEPRKGYFVYRNPETSTAHALGRISRREAIAQAMEANQYIEQVQTERLVHKLHAIAHGERFTDWIDQYQKILERRALAPSTARQNEWKLERIRQEFGQEIISELQHNVRRWAEWLDSYTEQGKARMAVSFRSILLDVWREAIASGQAQNNPISITRPARVTIQRARLTLDTAKLILEEAKILGEEWLLNAIKLGLVTAQRREDIVAIQFRERTGSTAWIGADGLYVRQKKTDTRIIIPLDLSLNALNLNLGQILDDCRGRIVTPWVIHQTRPRGNSPVGSPIFIDTVTKRFAHVRDKAAEKAGKKLWEPHKAPPTFHELRSLATRLYAEQFGGDFAQALAGHKDPKMTAVYRDVRGSEWVKVFKTSA